MKQLICLTLAFMLLVSFYACGKTSIKDDLSVLSTESSNPAESDTESSTEESSMPETTSDISETPDISDVTSEPAIETDYGFLEGGYPIGHVGEWIVYLNTDYMICKVKVDGSQREKICDDEMPITKPIIIDDCIYYINENDGDKLYSIGIDGNGKKKYAMMNCVWIQLEQTGREYFSI